MTAENKPGRPAPELMPELELKLGLIWNWSLG
jgi:hypothetical protein